MIIALTGAGISAPSGIPTFQSQPGIRDKLTRDFAKSHPAEYEQAILGMKATCDAAKPNDAHAALAEYGIPVITMNVDGLHAKASSEHVLEIHGRLPDIVLYGDPAPRYQDALGWIDMLRPGDRFVIVGTSFYTRISAQLRDAARAMGAAIAIIDADAEHTVRPYLEKHANLIEGFDALMARDPEAPVRAPAIRPPYGAWDVD